MKTEISVEDENNKLTKIFASEQRRLVNERASYSLTHTKGTTIITVESQDATALRAVLNSICKVLIVTEKVAQVTKDASRRSSTETSTK